MIVLFATQSFAQREIKATNSFTVSGRVKTTLTFNLEDLSKYSEQDINEIEVTKYDGTPRGILKGLKGIPILDILKQVEFDTDAPKELSEYYLIFEGSDGYKVVYSWNEIFNSKANDEIFIVTARNGLPLKDIKEKIILVTPKDFRTGRRYVKALSKIIVKRIE